LNNDQKNQFECVELEMPDVALPMLSEAVDVINTVLKKFKLDILMDPTSDWLDQHNLNVLHERWVKLQITHKNIVELLLKMPNNVVKKFHEINALIHTIEKNWNITYINEKTTAWQTPNIFGSDILKFGIWQAELTYQNLGRSNYDKWLNYDSNLHDTDTNNFTNFGGQVRFNLTHPVEQTTPLSYVEYCQKHNISPYGNKLPLGNFKNSITELRHIFNKNVNIKNNTITFKV
jgi:hypothetical protein